MLPAEIPGRTNQPLTASGLQYLEQAANCGNPAGKIKKLQAGVF